MLQSLLGAPTATFHFSQENAGPTMPHFIIYIESVYIYTYNLKGRWIFFHVKFIDNLHN